MSDWYFVRSGRREGPVSMGFVADEIRRGRLSDEDLVWGETMEAWQRVGDLPELVDLARQTPPPLPAELAHAEVEARAQAAAQAVPDVPTLVGPASGAAYASFGPRIGAHIIDQIPFILLGALIILLFYDSPDPTKGLLELLNDPVYRERAFFVQTIILVLECVYYACFESSRLQATPGKRLFKLRVCGIAGSRISFARAVARAFTKAFAIGFGLLSIFFFVSVFFTPRRQALHDLLVNTVVVADVK